MIIRVVPMVLGELYLSFYLRGAVGNIVDQKKSERYWRTGGVRKNIVVLNLTILWDKGRY